MPDNRIETLHPDPKKKGVNIDRSKYEQIRESIIETFRSNGEQTYSELAATIRGKLKGRFEGSVTWYVTVVKLDLEARGVLVRIPKTRPVKLRLAED